MNAGEKSLRVPMPSFSFREGWEEQEAFKPEPLDFAERRAVQAELFGDQAEAHGDYKAAKLHRTNASAWRNDVTALNDLVVSMNGIAASESVDVLLTQATVGSEQALTVLLALVNQILEGLHALASNGHTGAGGVLLASITKATNAFGILAHRRPDVFLPTTRTAFGVPAVVSRFPEKTRDNAALVKVLEVGKNYLLPLPTEATGRGNQMQFQTPANLWMFRVYAHVMDARDRSAKFARLSLEEQQRTVALCEAAPAWIDTAATLKPLCKETFSEWRDVIWAVVLDATNGKPEEESVLKALQKLPLEYPAKYSDKVLKTKPAAFRNKIKEAFARALQQLVAQCEKTWR